MFSLASHIFFSKGSKLNAYSVLAGRLVIIQLYFRLYSLSSFRYSASRYQNPMQTRIASMLPNFQLSVLAVSPIRTLSTVTAHPFSKNELDAMRLIHSSIRSISLSNISLPFSVLSVLLNTFSP